MHVLLCPAGSAGDVLPHVALGRELARRGHDVSVMANEVFGEAIDRTGLEFIRLGDREIHEQVIRDPNIWHPTKALSTIFRYVLRFTGEGYDLVLEHLRPDSVLVAGSLAFGARFAQEKTGVPMATVHLQPSSFMSVHHPLITPGMRDVSWMPKWARRGLLSFVDHVAFGLTLKRGLNRIRASRGLPPIRGRTTRWWNSPDLVIGYFPEWFAPRQPDWPENVELTGFPVFGGPGDRESDPRLEAFLEAGAPPVVMSPGSANCQAGPLLAGAVEALHARGHRGLLLTPYEDQVPELPEGFLHVDYLPFEDVLPRCAGLIHHGGIGTLSQAIAAGIPQLIHPLAFDQPENAVRVERLGVGGWVSRKRFRGAPLEAAIARIFEGPAARDAARRLAERFHERNGAADTAILIERLGERRLSPSSS